jgi:hypothetical protein
MSLKKINSPELFQGNFKKKHYFEGWYFKHVSADGQHTIAFIPGISLDGADSHSFVQVIVSPGIKTYYFRYPLNAFSTNDAPFSVTIGESVFTMQGCKIKLDDATQEISQGVSFAGEIRYSEATPIQASPLMPNIMGFFAYIPNMECNHGVLSMNHQLFGEIKLSDHEIYNFTGGKGYIEKDWGTSFPSEYIWIQANHFEDDNHSFMCSIATIPFGLFSFRGLIANLLVDGTEYRFATYNRTKVQNFIIEKHSISFDLVKGDVTLSCEALLAETGELKGPNKGEMHRTIKEGLSGDIILSLKRNGLELLILKSSNVSIEINSYI